MACAGQRLPARLLARADRPRQPEVRAAEHARASSVASSPDATELPRPRSTARSWTTSTPLSSCRAAEMAKLLENTFRMVNIALVNELRGAVRRPGHRHLGGHRGRGHQAVRVHAVLPRPGRRRALHPARPDLPRLAVPPRHRPAVPAGRARPGHQRRDAGLRRPAHHRRAGRARGRRYRGARVLALGVTYKPDVGDLRESAAVEMLAQLAGEAPRSATTTRSWPGSTRDGLALRRTAPDPAKPRAADLVVVLTPHDAYDLRRAHAARPAGLRRPQRARGAAATTGW